MSVGTVSTSIATAAYDATRTMTADNRPAAPAPAPSPAVDLTSADDDGPIRSAHPTMGTMVDTYL